MPCRNHRRHRFQTFRRRLKRQGIVRVEVRVRKDDAALLRCVAQALGDPGRQAEVCSLLRPASPRQVRSASRPFSLPHRSTASNWSGLAIWDGLSIYELPDRHQHYLRGP